MLEGFESGELAIKIMTGKFPMVPQITNAISDVRDVALAHLLALEVPAAAGKRFIAAHQCRSFVDIIGMFAAERPALKIPARSMPNFLLNTLALCNPELKRAKTMVKKFKVDEETTRTTLGIQWTPETKTVADMMDDFINLGAVPAEKQ